MARISGVDLPKNKRIEIALTYIYGIGRTSANKILAATGINPDTRVKDLTEQDEAALREVIGRDYMVEGDLRRGGAMAATEACATARACPSVASAARPTLVPARVPSVPSRTRRSKGGKNRYG